MNADGGQTLVLGGTSLVGRFLVPMLVERGAAPCVLTRRSGAGEPRRGEGRDVARWIQADLTEPDRLAMIGSVQTVFSLSPIWLLPDALPALNALGATRLIAFSSTSRFTKAASTSPYERDVAAMLADGEARTIAFCESHGIGWTILRPTLIYAEGQDGNVSRLAGLIRRFGALPLAGGGEGLRQPVHAEDLAIGALAAISSGAASGCAYDLPGAETLTYRAMVERVFEGLGRRPRIVTIPPSLFKLALTLARPLLPGVTVQMGARIGEDLTFDPAPAQRDLSWAPRDFHPRF